MRGLVLALCGLLRGLNESPSKKEGKSHAAQAEAWKRHGLNESPSKKEGKFHNLNNGHTGVGIRASMKAPPRRKGNRAGKRGV